MAYKLMKVLFLFENKVDFLKMVYRGERDAKRGYFGVYKEY